MKQFFTLLGIVAMGATAYGQKDTDFVNIPDIHFKNKLLKDHEIDTNKDGEISYGEAKAYKGHLNLIRTQSYYSNKPIKSLIGIEAFVNIIKLSCEGNELKSLDLSKNTALQELFCNYNQLTNLDLSKNSVLSTLWCQNNQLTSLDVSKNTALQRLECDNNRLTSLDVSKNTALSNLRCHNNQLTSLDVSKNTTLHDLYCNNNQLTSLDVSKNRSLSSLHCHNNQLTSLDVSKNRALLSLYCNYNQLTQLNLANGNNTKFIRMNARGNKFLKCIQIDRRFTPPPYSYFASSRWEKDFHASYSDNCNYNLSIDEVKTDNNLQILNPVKDNLVIKTTAKVEKVEIYNTAGQLVKVLFKGNTQVQDLAKGAYLVKITTDKGTTTQKIIKS